MNVAAPGRDVGTRAPPPAVPPSGPYVGVVPFGEEDEWRFFGREAETRVIASNLLASRLTLLYGPSGVGKTSVLRASVVPYLRAAAEEEAGDGGAPPFTVVYFNSWRDEPVEDLLAAVREQVGRHPALRSAAERLPPPDGPLAATLGAWARALDGDLLVILDQFEDYFLYHPDDDGDRSFAAAFAGAVNAEPLPVDFLVSIREDALAKFDRFKGTIRHLFESYLRVDHLSKVEARGAITGPLRRYARANGPGPTEIEPDLVEAVVQQVGAGKVVVGQAGRGTIDQTGHGGPADGGRVEAAHLQLVMSRLWHEEREAGSPVLRLAALERLGGAQQIVRAHLDDVMTTLSPEDQHRAALVFHQLVTPSGTKITHSVSDLASYTGISHDELVPVLEQLAAGERRILRPVPPSPDAPGESRFEIFHDVLAPGVLDWRNRHLEAVKRAEVEASLEQQRRQTRLASLVAVVMVFLLVVTIVSWASAVRTGRAAAEQRAVARSRELATEATSLLSEDPRQGLQLALAAVEESTTREAQDALRRLLANWAQEAEISLDARVVSVTASPSGGRFAAVTEDGGLTIRDGAEGQELGHAESVLGARFLEEGRLLAVTVDGAVLEWDGSRLRDAGEVPVPAGDELAAHAVSPDGHRVAVGGTSGDAWVLDVPRGTVTGVAEPHDGAVTALALSDNGELLGTASADGTAKVFDARTGERVMTFAGHIRTDGRITASSGMVGVASIAFSPDGRTVVTAGADGACRTWSAETGAGSAFAPSGQGLTMITASFSADGERALCGGEKRVWVFDAHSNARGLELRGHTDRLTSASFSVNSERVVTTSRDGTARVWDAVTGAMLLVLNGHDDAVLDAEFLSRTDLVVTGSADRSARTWSMTRQGRVVLGSWRMLGAEFDRDGTTFAALGVSRFGQEGEVLVWDADSMRSVAELPVDGLLPASFALTPDGEHAAIGGSVVNRGAVRVIDLDDGSPVAEVEYDTPVGSVDVHPRGDLVVAAGTDGVVRMWNWRTGETWESDGGDADGDATVDGGGEAISSARFGPDGSEVVTADLGGAVRFWRTDTLVPARRDIPSGSALYDAAFSSDGGSVVTAGGDGVARVWDLATGLVVLQLPKHPGRLSSATFDDDGTHLVTGTAEGYTAVWDVSDPERGAVNLAMARTHGDAVNSVRFAPGTTTVLSASDDRSVRLRTCITCREVDELVALAEERLD